MRAAQWRAARAGWWCLAFCQATQTECRKPSPTEERAFRDSLETFNQVRTYASHRSTAGAPFTQARMTEREMAQKEGTQFTRNPLRKKPEVLRASRLLRLLEYMAEESQQQTRKESNVA